MLFSEPKIPQLKRHGFYHPGSNSFSALQRAENSSMMRMQSSPLSCRPFQCSSASRKFLNPRACTVRHAAQAFQCSSASRKFLNRAAPYDVSTFAVVSVLFSEPKIPQSTRALSQVSTLPSFSALQRAENSSIRTCSAARSWRLCFSALQRAENSSMVSYRPSPAKTSEFQCSSASRKFLNRRYSASICASCNGFSALQRAENSSILFVRREPPFGRPFQCSSASRKFLNLDVHL